MINDSTTSDEISPLEALEIELLLEGIFQLYGYDFRNYVLSSIRRRIWHRVREERLNTISGLQEKAFHDSNCMKRLLADFSIQVTEMFRDPSFFVSFRKSVIPILQKLPSIRIWHAGCSTGEEVYSMAILLKEAGLYDRARLYATDMNANALAQAKSRVFPIAKMKTYTSNYQQTGGQHSFSNYYQAFEDHVVFDAALSKNIVFAQHNLATDGSFNEFNVILCRNVMIYFNKELQNRSHQLFFESLHPSGFLILGKKESIQFSLYADQFSVLDNEERIYQKRNEGN